MDKPSVLNFFGVLVSACTLVSIAPACTEDEGRNDTLLGDGETTLGDGDTVDTGDGDGDTADTGDGDGDTTDTTDTGDGDGDTTDTTDTTTDTGDGDGDTTGGESPCMAADPGWGSFASVGAPAPHFSGINHLGDEVSICAYEGLPIVIDTSAVWCGPCQEMSKCLGGNDNSCVALFGDPNVLDLLIYPLRTEIAADQFAWVTVLTENAQGGAPSMADAVNWDANYPAEKIWVISDTQQLYYGHLPIMAFPSIWLIDPSMNWQDLDQMTVFGTIIQSYL